MAAETNVQVIIGAKDNASSTLKKFGANASDTSKKFEADFKAAGLAASGFLASLTALAGGAVKLASSFEQNRIAFETMLGSADAARGMMEKLAKFTLETPFEMTQVVEGAKRLSAYGIEAEKIIPTFKMLGDMAAGVGVDKLPNLVLAFGQVKAATKLTGAELRQFTEAGIPLLDALVDKANEAGGRWVTMGGSAKKAKVDVGELNDKLAIAKQRLKEASDSGKAKESTLMSLRNTIQNYEEKLSKANETTGEAKKVWSNTKVTVADMIDSISEGEVTFQQVEEALQGLTSEGGKFQDMMKKQSETLAGVWSNIKDKVVQSMSEIAGVSVATGEIREGSLFAVLKDAAVQLMGALDVITPKIIDFFNWVSSNKTALTVIAGVIGGLLVSAAVGFVAAFGGAIAVASAFAGAGGAIALAVGYVIDKFGGLDGVKTKIDEFLDKLLEFKDVTKGYIDNLSGYFDAFVERLYDTFDLDTGQISFENFFSQMLEKMLPSLNEFTAQIRQGFQNAFNIDAGGEGGGFEDTIGRIMSMLQPAADLFLRVLTPAINSVKDAFAQSKPQIDEFLQLIGPILINSLKVIAGAIAVFIGAIALIVVAFTEAFAYALPAIMTFVNGVLNIFNGVLQFFSGFFMILTGNFKDGFGQIFEGVKSIVKGIWEVISGVFLYVLAFIAGFIKGVIDFFKNLYDVLIGHSIIPDLVNGVINYFKEMADKVIEWASSLFKGVTEKFDALKEKVETVINFIRDLIDNFKPHIEIGIDMPNLEEAWSNLKDRAHNLGIPGFQTGGIVPGPVGAPALAMVHGGEQINPVGRTGGTGGQGANITLNAYIGLYTGSETEKRNVARELYGALVQVASSQNKSVKELMGG